MLHAAYLMILFPLAGFCLLAMFGRRLGKPRAGWLATAMVAASFVVSIVVVAGLAARPAGQRSFTQVLFTWIPVGALHVKVGLLIDPLSMTMALFVTGVSALIHLYSIEYMDHDEQFPKFFVYLNLFVASMLVLVLADNFLFSFLGWEGVGLCSYLLIAFWFDRDSAATAGKKAFVVNRIGDFGFLMAMLLIFTKLGTLDYQDVFARLGQLSHGTITAIVLLLFLGAVGKSAQLPLFTWLPDAMEGPTPVSALIHAATMVTAGVYLMVRVSPMLHLASGASLVIAAVGVVTAFVAATIACAQDDVKKVLAYSTVSQLGYMFLAVGTGAYVAAIFLMICHAFYKGLLFLGAGSIIHGLHDEQDLKRMGGLRKVMPFTFVTFGIGWLAIAGVPPFAAFWSKGDVLLGAFSYSPALYALGALTAVLTAYYMGRELFLAFYGPERWRKAGVGGGEHHAEPHDPSWVMKLPLLLLAGASALAGLINLPFHPSWDFLETWLAPVVAKVLVHSTVSTVGRWELALGDAVLAFVGVGIAWKLWGKRWDLPSLEPAVLRAGWGIDAMYDRVIAQPGTALATFMAAAVDTSVIDGVVNGVARAVRATGDSVRRLQTGFVRSYAVGVMLGVVLLLVWMLTRAVS